MKINFKRINCAVLAVLILFVCMLAARPGGGLATFAESVTSVSEFEKRNVLDDIATSELDSEKFSLENWGFDETRDTQIYSFVEYGYSFYANKQNDFGLYVYIYNPQGVEYVAESDLNKITLSVGDTENYAKYPLLFLNCSHGELEGLFYKYKVILSADQRTEFITTLDPSERVYKISEIELLIKDTFNGTTYDVANSYKYSGYAAGYGPNTIKETTLTCFSDKITTLPLVVHHIAYRPEGSNGKDMYTQDSINSVYFEIPKEYTQEYGAINAIHATWLNAKTNIGLVTGNKQIYDKLYTYLGNDIGYGNQNVGYAIRGGWYDGSSVYHPGCEVAYNPLSDWSGGSAPQGEWQGVKQLITRLDLLFSTEGKQADNYILTSEDLTDFMRTSSQSFDEQDKILGKYSRRYFSEVAEEFTEVNLKGDETFSITSQVWSQNFWEKYFSGHKHVESSTTYDGIEVIHKVQDEDFSNADKIQSLFVPDTDFEEFKNYYNAQKEQSDVYLFRFDVSDYKAWEARETGYCKVGLANVLDDGEVYNLIDTNAYFFQENCYLDFDIIDVTFKKGDVQTVIPIVMSPIDIIPDVTPPPFTTADSINWLAFIIVEGVLLVIFIITARIQKKFAKNKITVVNTVKKE